METLTIKFDNWSKFQPRNDYKHPWWFALSNTFPTDRKLHSFTNEEKFCLICILCEASVQNKYGEVEITIEHFCHLNKISNKILMQTIEKITSVQIAYMIGTESVPTEQNRTEQNTTKHNKTISSNLKNSQSQFDLESLYAKYPRKMGKGEGLRRLGKCLRTMDDYVNFTKAIDRYAAHCVANGTEPNFIMHFSTFVGTPKSEPWKDWLDSETGSSVAVVTQKKFNKAEQRSENNKNALNAALEKIGAEKV